MVVPNLQTASITSTGSTQSRTLGARFSDIINVKDFGATGLGGDYTTNIQAALDAAFGSSGSPHGSANKFLNKAVYFPNGDYRISSPGLTLTDVDGGHIFGSGIETTKLTFSGISSGIFMFNVNGMINSRMERMWIDATANNGGIDLDWDGSGVGLNNNFFSDMLSNGGTNGIRIAQSGNQGHSNTFFNVTVGGYSGSTGLKIVGANAVGNNFYGAGGDTCAIGIHVSDGQMSNIMGTSWGTGVTTACVKIDNSSQCAIQGGRYECINFLNSGTAKVYMAAVSGLGAAGYMATMANPGSVTMDGCYFSGGGNRKTILGTGILYLRGNYFVDTTAVGAAPAAVLAGFTGSGSASPNPQQNI